MAGPTMPNCHLPYGEVGAGTYSSCNRDGYQVITDSRATVMRAIELSRRPLDGPFVVCDFGTADGGTSMDLITECIQSLKEKHGQDQEVMVIYEDQATNDFKSLINRLYGLLPGQSSYMTSSTGVYVTFSATQFYKQCLPSSTLDLGLCFTAVHLLSQRISPGKGAIFNMLSCDEHQKALIKAQAARDLEAFLLARSRELKPGGQLVVAGMAIDDSGPCWRMLLNLMETLTTCWKGMVERGRIQQEEFDATVAGGYLRTQSEYTSSFYDVMGPVYKSGIRLVSSEIRIIDDPGFTQTGNAKEVGYQSAAKDYARVFVSSVRPWSNSMFRTALAMSRTEEDMDRILDEFFADVESKVSAAPELYREDCVVVRLHAVKVECKG